MEKYADHGGDWSGKLLDFSANVAPLRVPADIRAALRRAELERYPDPLCRRLCDAIGRAEQVPPAWVLCGNGASDLIYRAALAKRPRRAVVTAPAFSEYEAALTLSGCEAITRYFLREETDFRLDDDFLNVITPETEMIFLCQPNNPTGVSIPATLLRRIWERCRESGCLLVMDECFLGFLNQSGDSSVNGPAKGNWLMDREFTLKDAASENLLFIRAFTKLYGMAGVRLGYALCSDAAFLERMRQSGPPWSVSSPAQAAGMALLKSVADGGSACAYADTVRRLIARERPRVLSELRNLGLRVIPGEANFLLFQSPKPLDAPLRRRGILLRNCGNFHGLDQSWYRTAIRTAPENRRLLAALKEIFTGGKTAS